MRAISVYNANAPVRIFVATTLCTALIALAGCGSNDKAVAADGTGQSGGASNGGSQGSGNGGGNSGGGAGGGNGTGGNTGSGTNPVTGDTLMPVPSATPVSKFYSCKSEAPGEEDVALNLELTFDPATLEFLVDGDLVLTGGFVWNEASMEWVASEQTSLASDALLEIFAKVALDDTPTYFRRKLTQADYSFVQTECYEGLVLGSN